MVIEVLYPEVANLFGDLANIRYLEKILPEVTFHYTHLQEEPYFKDHEVSFVYMGPMSEHSQELVIEALFPYKNILKEMIEKDIVFLITGNALEVFCDFIEEDEKKIKGLGIFPFYVKRKMYERYNGLCLGRFQNMKIVGFKSQFTELYGDNEKNFFLEVERGRGIHATSFKEGIAVRSFFGTYLLGPILILNPAFTKYLLKLLHKEVSLLYEKELLDAYDRRLKEFQDPKVKF